MKNVRGATGHAHGVRACGESRLGPGAPHTALGRHPGGDGLSGRIADGGIVETNRVVFGESVGAVAIAEDGGLLVAAEKGLATIDASGQVHRGPRILSAGGNTRLNDGACDPAGRYLVGSLTPAATAADQVLLQIETTGAVTVLRSDIGLSNGIAWSPSGEAVYHVDTTARTCVDGHYDPPSGRVGSGGSSSRSTDGLPDGMTVDEEGFLWIAVWGRGQVRRYDLAGGSTDGHGRRAAFIQRRLRRPGLGHAGDHDRAQRPDPGRPGAVSASGALFLARTDVRGLPEHAWAGATPRTPRAASARS